MSDCRFQIHGMCPAEIRIPITLEETQSIVQDAQGKCVIPWGGGKRQHVGYPPEHADLILSTERLSQVTDYQPADLTVTVQAGATVTDLQNALAVHGQWLPLDVACPDIQTIGGVVAARAGSLTRFAHGTVRDHLIGVTVVNHHGEVIKGGGKVVKNVAGYDLPKLYCGSWGTLGLIVDATFKVAPLPDATVTVLLPLDANLNCEETLDALLTSDLSPSLVVLLSANAARDILDADDDTQYLVLGFDGSADAVAWQAETLGAPGILPDAIGRNVRKRVRDFPLRDAPMACTFQILSSQVGAYSRMMEWTARRHGLVASVVSDAAVGIVHAQFAPTRDEADWRVFAADFQDKATRVGGSCVIERMPDVLRALDCPVWSPVLADFALMDELKRKLDPPRMWNPGRFVGRL